MYNVNKKKINYSEDVYYFDIYTNNYPVTIHRKDRELAIKTFRRYQRAGKRCQWLGRWNGKKFEESQVFAS